VLPFIDLFALTLPLFVSFVCILCLLCFVLDLWSLGCIIYEMSSLELLPVKRTNLSLMKQEQVNELIKTKISDVSEFFLLLLSFVSLFIQI
jgi:hypothetical protein